MSLKRHFFVASTGPVQGDKILNKNDLFGADTGSVHDDKIINKNDLFGAGTRTIQCTWRQNNKLERSFYCRYRYQYHCPWG